MALQKESVNLWLIPPDDIGHVWEQAAELLQQAIDRNHGEHTLATLYAMLVKGEFQLWTGYYMGTIVHAGISRILTYNTGLSVCELMYLAGSRMDNWLNDHIRIIEQWAKANGCRYVDIPGRDGWERVMKGYKRKYVVMTKELG